MLVIHRQYYINPYLTKFQTSVISSTERDGEYHTILKETIFYPEGGGQPSDRGTINSIPVIDVYEDKGTVYHVTEEEIERREVDCELDWSRRFYYMQHHSGQHLLSAVLYEEKRLNTFGFHLGEEYATIDIDGDSFGEDLQDYIEDVVNSYIVKNTPIITYWKTPEEMGSIPLRKGPVVDKDIRIVEITNLDYSPCCGIHLLSTGEIGLLKIHRVERCRDKNRIYFRCGEKAFEDYRMKHKTIVSLCTSLSVPPDQVLSRFQREMDRQDRLQVMNKQLKEELLKYRAQEIIKSTQESFLHIHVEEYLWDHTKQLAREILNSGPYILLMSAGTRLFLYSHHDRDFHCKEVVKECTSRFQGTGGGSKSAAQILLATEKELVECREYIREYVLSKK